MQGNLERIVTEVKMLPPQELAQLQRLVAGLRECAMPEVAPAMSEDEFERRLAADGFLRQVPPALGDSVVDDDFQPVVATGRPVSEMIIEERR